MDIVIPETDPADVYQYARTPFVAIARDEKGGDVSDLATFTWSFPDAKEPVGGNPAIYRFEKTGKFTVSVTATLEKDSGSDQISVNVIEFVGTKSNPTAEDFVFYACSGAHTFGGTVCDGVGLVAKPDGDLPLGWDWTYASFQKWVGGQWVEQYGQVPDYEYGVGWIASTGWSTEIQKNEEIDWRVMLALDEVGSDPPNFVDLPVEESWTPANTVVKATGDEIILHEYPEDDSHTIGWTIGHYSALSPTFTVTVKIYDLSGNLVETLVEEDVEVGADSTAWDEDLPEASGVYTYRIIATHSDDPAPPYPCSDKDRSEVLTFSNVTLPMHDFDPTDQIFSYRIEYDLSRAAAENGVELRVYDRRMAEVHHCDLLPCDAGRNSWLYHFACDPAITGPYFFVLSAVETPSDGSQNRDGLSKPAVQKGLVNCVYPRASHWSDHAAGWEYGPGPEWRLANELEDTCYAPSVHEVLPAKQAFLDAWEDDGIFLLQSHGDPGIVHISGSLGMAWLMARCPSFYTPTDDDVVLDQLPLNEFPHVYLVQYPGCDTADNSSDFGNLCVETRNLGVDITLGFEDIIYMQGPSAVWEEHFYGWTASSAPLSVQNAACYARDRVYQLCGAHYGYNTFVIGPISRRDESLWPARYGD